MLHTKNGNNWPFRFFEKKFKNLKIVKIQCTMEEDQ